MSDEDDLFTIDDEIAKDISEGVSRSDSEIIEFRDSSTKVAEVLIPQFGSDGEYLGVGKVDTRRFTNIPNGMEFVLSWFEMVPKEYGGNWSGGWCDQYRNHRYSVNGEHKKFAIGITNAVSGNQRKQSSENKRTLMDRVLGRNKAETELYDVSDK